MFILDREQQQLLVEVLNNVNRFTFDQWCQMVRSSGGKARPGTYSPWSAKSSQPVIVTLGHSASHNQRQLIASIFGLYYHFKDYFSYSFNLEFNVPNLSTKNERAIRIVNWLARFFKHSLLVNIDFDRVFELSGEINQTNGEEHHHHLQQGVNKELRPKTMTNNNPRTTSFNGDVKKEDSDLYQQHNDYTNDSSNNNSESSFQQSNACREDLFTQLIILVLLFLHLLYKLRHLFPTTATMLENFWKYLSSIDDILNKNFLNDNYIHFLCHEIGEQRRRNAKRVTELRDELSQMERLAKQIGPSSNSMMMANDNNNNHHQQQQQFLPVTLNDCNHNNNAAAAVDGSGNYKKSNLTISNQMSQPTGSGRSSGSGKSSAGLACLICHKVFRNSYKLNRHQYVHKDASEKPLACSYENCNYRSISNNDLNRHRMIHTGEKPYLCNINGCEKRYSRPDKLRNHRNSIHFKDSNAVSGSRGGKNGHNSIKSFVCVASGCNFHTTNRNEFNNHTLSHVYRCEQFSCGKQFDKADKLRRHLERDHGLMSSAGLVTNNGNVAALANCNGTNPSSNHNFNQMTANSSQMVNSNGQGRSLNPDYAAAMAAIRLPQNLAVAAAAHHQQSAVAADLASVISSTIAHNAQLASIGGAGGGAPGQSNTTTLSMLSAVAAGSDQMSAAQFDQLHHQLLAVAAAGGGGNNQAGTLCNGQSLEALGLNGHPQQQQQSQQQQLLGPGLSSLWPSASDYNTLKERH